MNIHQNNGTVLKIPLNTIDSITYDIKDSAGLASIATTSISSITSTTAISGGMILNDGGSSIAQKGICWSTNPNPTISDNITLDGNGVASFTSNLSNLKANTSYFVRAYAINDVGIAYGNELNFTTNLEIIKSGNITSNETWYADSIYLLSGKVYVKNGATLTIQPGTIIKGKQGYDSTASVLVITRGSKIIAEGTALKPIIFTSELDNIAIGQKTGTNLTKTDNQKWGGLIILGAAPISATNNDIESFIDGLDVADRLGLYGGNNATDNSGILKYVSIRHGGVYIGGGYDINALSLFGVGSGTTVENIEVYGTLDDGVEFFGGSVNTKNILVYYAGDDGIDIDQNYSGIVENFMVVQGDGIGTDKGLEIDGPEGTYTNGLFTLRNGLVKTEGKEGVPADFKDKAQGTIENVTFEYDDATVKEIKIRANFDAQNSCASRTDAYTNLTETTPKLTFMNTKLGVAKAKVYTNVTACINSLTATEQANVEAKITNGSGGTVSANLFQWTGTFIRGEIK